MSLFSRSSALAASALALALSLSPLGAAPYADGDLLMGFVTASSGSEDTLIARLGTAASFRDGFDGGTSQINFATIGTQLNTLYSPAGGDTPWYNRPDLYVSIFAATGSNTEGSELFGRDPYRTIYVSRSRSATNSVAGSARSTAWTLGTNAGMTTGSSQINVTGGRYFLSTADPGGVAIIAKSEPNTLDQFTRPTTNVSFGAFSGGVEQTLTATTWGTLGAAGTVEAALDLYRLQAVNDIPGQYGAGNAVRSGVYKGTFTINQSGQISFIAAGAASGFNAWAISKGLPGGVATSDDRDSDNIPALVEYGLDLNPLAFSSLPAPTLGAGGLQFAFTKGAAAAADPQISFQIEASSQLASGWSLLTPTTNNSSQISALLPSNDPSGRLFGRLKVVKAN